MVNFLDLIIRRVGDESETGRTLDEDSRPTGREAEVRVPAPWRGGYLLAPASTAGRGDTMRGYQEGVPGEGTPRYPPAMYSGTVRYRKVP